MRALTLACDSPAQARSVRERLTGGALGDPAWVLMYCVPDAAADLLMDVLAQLHPRVPVFGATSSRGVFSASGFGRDPTLLVGERADEIRVALALEAASQASAAAAAARACREIERALGQRPDIMLLHATPGFEEQILAGIGRAVGDDVPVYGGSAADDEMAGNWRVFADGRSCAEGFVLAGIASVRPVLSAFIGGYVPTANAGVVTRAEGRTVFEIDGRPAAVVYNEWTHGLIDAELATGGNVVFKTNSLPLARIANRLPEGTQQRLLAHPHEVVAGSRALRCLSEIAAGEPIMAMTTTRESLVARVRRVVQRARAYSALPPRGGVLIYCSGSLDIVSDQAALISSEFQCAAGDIPVVGAATFGEQGRFREGGASRHGNLMCSVLLF
jgi:hypothetical protein